jgi:hypothetical protein
MTPEQLNPAIGLFVDETLDRVESLLVAVQAILATTDDAANGGAFLALETAIAALRFESKHGRDRKWSRVDQGAAR